MKEGKCLKKFQGKHSKCNKVPKTGKVVKICARNVFLPTISFSFSSLRQQETKRHKNRSCLHYEFTMGSPLGTESDEFISSESDLRGDIKQNCMGLCSYGFISEIAKGL